MQCSYQPCMKLDMHLNQDISIQFTAPYPTTLHSLQKNSSATENSFFFQNCIYLVVCDEMACTNCKNILIPNCDHCNYSVVVFLLCYAILVSLSIFIANVVIIFVGVKHHRMGTASKIEYCRTSLAVADLLIGKCYFFKY